MLANMAWISIIEKKLDFKVVRYSVLAITVSIMKFHLLNNRFTNYKWKSVDRYCTCISAKGTYYCKCTKRKIHKNLKFVNLSMYLKFWGIHILIVFKVKIEKLTFLKLAFRKKLACIILAQRLHNIIMHAGCHSSFKTIGLKIIFLDNFLSYYSIQRTKSPTGICKRILMWYLFSLSSRL